MAKTAKKSRRSSPARSSSGRRKTPRTKKNSAQSKAPTWLNEAIALSLFALATFLLVSILSCEFSSGNVQTMVLSSTPRANLMGPVGHMVGTILTGVMGWCALVPVFWAVCLGIAYWRKDDSEPAIIRPAWALLVGLVGVLLASCTLGAIIATRSGGGSLGTSLAEPLVKLFNPVGAGVFVSTFLVFAIALSLKTTVATVLLSSSSLIMSALRFALIELPQIAWYWTCVAYDSALYVLDVSLELFGFHDVLDWWHERRERKAAEHEVPLPKPRRHRNTLEVEDEESDDEEVDEDYSHVVVQRRSTERRVSERMLKQHKQRVKEQLKEFDPEQAWAKYEPPEISLLKRGEPAVGNEDDETLRQMSRLIESKLRDFKISGKVTHVHPGPVITLFEFEPAAGVKVGRIAALQDDLAMSLRASSIRIIAPIPKRGSVGIEVPNKHRELVRLRDLLESEKYVEDESILTIPLGKDTYGEPVLEDIASMPHLLIAGATGTGKSVCINTVLLSLLYRSSPAELGLILIDPKILELSVYDGIPHLRVPVVTVPRQAKAVLEWAVHEMNRRYRLMQRYGVRNIDGFNRMARGEDEERKAPVADDVISLDEEQVVQAGTVEKQSQNIEDGIEPELVKPMPKIVIVIDELADLMLSVGKEIEDLIARLAQKARAAGIHLIVATQRPSVDVVTGLIKANFPARMSFRVSSRVDSRTILDEIGAEKLLGKGDMLFMAPGAVHVNRLHGAFVSDTEVKRVIKAIKKNGEPHYDDRIVAVCEKALEEESNSGSGSIHDEIEYDSYYDQAVELVVEKGKASTSLLQRAFRIGYNRAARIIDTMEAEGIIGPMDGARPREVLVPGQDYSPDEVV